jgi:deazaflavin-dependent oxidoreductase (nitroreductase family)
MDKFMHRAIVTSIFTLGLVKAIQAVAAMDPKVRRDYVRRFNKRFLNPFALWLVSWRRMYYGILHHTGRRSGKVYATPVVANLTSHGVIIPLPYGTGTDWCKNVLAAGSCRLTLNGEECALNSPQVVPASVAEALVPRANATVWRHAGIANYLSMEREISVPESPERPRCPSRR